MKHKREGGGDEPAANEGPAAGGGEEPAAAPAGGVARAKSPPYDPFNDAHVYGKGEAAVTEWGDGTVDKRMADAAKEVVGECVS